MPADADIEVFCPRCRYNLRGLPEPRCPECGLTFTAEMWASGVLREHVPTWLDRCDPWQPHQVLIRSLYELFRGALRPRWVLTKLDLNGPLRPAMLMLVLGTVWLYVIITVFVAVATFIHTGASPYASLKSAGLCVAPRMLAAGLAPTALIFGLLIFPNCMHVRAPTRHDVARIAGYWMPSSVAYVLVPLGFAILVSPDFAFGGIMSFVWPMLSGVPVALGIAVRSRNSLLRIDRVRVLRRGLLVGPVWLVVGCGFAGRLVPDSLEPPLWIYF